MKKYTFNDYYKKLKSGLFQTAIKLSWLNADETVQFEFTNFIYNMTGSLNVNYQNGARRSCSIEIAANDNNFPIDYDHIWIGQKFQLWMGIYMDELQQEPYYFSQGIFYVKNPKETFNPQTQTITLQGVDKWAYLDGSLFGQLNSNYKILINTDLREATKEMLKLSRFEVDSDNHPVAAANLIDMLDPKEPLFDMEYNNLKDDGIIQYFNNDTYGNKIIYKTKSNEFFIICLDNSNKAYKKVEKTEEGFKLSNSNLNETPTEYSAYTAEQPLYKNPYTLTLDKTKTYADLVLEIATRLRASVYYDVDGHLVFTPFELKSSDYANFDKVIAWNYNIAEQEFLGSDLEYQFDKAYNVIAVYGKITNGYQAKAILENRHPESEISIDKIGYRPKQPYVDDNYQSNQQCLDLAYYYAMTDMIMNVTGSISSLPLYHIDVGQMITIDTDKLSLADNNTYLVTGYSLPINSVGTMNLNITNMKLFENWTEVKEKKENNE
jgi:hypothetical protein